MANIIGLALKVTGDASGLAKSLTPVDRALDNLATQAERATAVFAPLARETAAAGQVQEEFAEKFEAISQQLRDGLVSPQQYAEAFARLTQEAKDSAAAFTEGLRVTAELRTEEEKRVIELDRLGNLLEQGAISQETFVRASERATGVEKERANALAAAARIIAANLTPQEKYDQQLQELTGHLEAGRLNQEQFNRAAQKAKRDLDGVGREAEKTDKNIESLNKNVRFLANVEIGRIVFDGVRLLGSAFNTVTGQITGLVSQVNSSIDTLNDFSARTGIGVEALQGYSLAAKLAGVDTEAFGTTVQRLAVSIGKAAPGGELDKALKGINLSVRELRALAPDQQFAAIGQAISQLPTAADRAAAAVQVFGKQGAALAPLFREGADSIDELRARADRLGVIISETQVENVAAMNDGFDLVGATLQGIIGQVTANLAPAVTAVTDEFLRFVETFNGVEGTGGAGIANRITDVLLQGAEVLAGVFDRFVSDFGDFTGVIETSSGVFRVVSESFTAVAETLRVTFNTFEVAGNALLVGFGQLLEGLGSWVDSDLERFGRDLSASGRAAMAANVRQLEEASANAQRAVVNAFSGGENTPADAGAGAAEQFINGIRERIERERSPQFQIETNIEQVRERFDGFFNGIVDQGSVVTDAMRAFEAAVADVQDPLALTAEEIDRIRESQDRVNQAIDQELANRQELAEAAAQQADADAKRIESLTKAGEAQTKLAEDLAAVEREQARVQEQLAAARDAADTAAADAAAAQLGRLDQLQARLQDDQQAAEQGFADGFARSFEATNRTIDELIDKAGQFGNVGANAAQQLEAAIESAQQQARDGILTRETYEREVARQQQIFAERLAGAQRVEEFLRGQLDERQRAELDAAAAVEERQKQAAQNVKAIQDRIAAEQQALEQARAGGDLRAARAGTVRLNQLRQAQRIEQGIVDGREAAGRGQVSGLARGFTQVEQFQSLVTRQNQDFLRSFSDTFGAANASLAAAGALAAEQARRAELSRPVEGAVRTADIRTAEGAALVLGLGAAEQDPALIEARLQTRQLNNIRTAIVNAVQGYLNTPVEIL